MEDSTEEARPGAGRLVRGRRQWSALQQEMTKTQKKPCGHLPDLFHLEVFKKICIKDLDENKYLRSGIKISKHNNLLT